MDTFKIFIIAWAVAQLLMLGGILIMVMIYHSRVPRETSWQPQKRSPKIGEVVRTAGGLFSVKKKHGAVANDDDAYIKRQRDER